MQIILLHPRMTQARSITLAPRHIALFVTAFIMAVMLVAGMLYYLLMASGIVWKSGPFADVVTLFYSRFQSVISQVPTPKQLIPAVVDGDAAPIDLNGAVYDYEPSEEEILETLLPRNITTQLFSAMLENQAGFFAAQMTAMDNATRNAGDMIASLTLQYNRSRQAQITKELIEIISGAEAL